MNVVDLVKETGNDWLDDKAPRLAASLALYSAQILFFGAELTQVHARRNGARIVPAANAVRFERKLDVATART